MAFKYSLINGDGTEQIAFSTADNTEASITNIHVTNNGTSACSVSMSFNGVDVFVESIAASAGQVFADSISVPPGTSVKVTSAADSVVLINYYEQYIDATAVSDVTNAVTTVKNNIASVNTVAGDIAKVTNVADSIADVSTVAGNVTNVNTVAADIAAVKTNADNIEAIQNAKTNALIAAGATNYKGDWDSNYSGGYALADSVTYTDGYNYVSKIDNNTTEPTSKTNTTEWNFVEAVSPEDLAAKADTTYVDNGLATKADKTNPIFTGSITEQVGTMTTAIDATLGTIQTLTLTADTTLTDNLSDGQSVTLILSNGGYTITYPTITWVGIEEPTLSTTDVIVFFKVGDTLYGSWNGATA